MQAVTMTRLSIMMFLQFFVWGAWYVTAPRFLGTIGFDGGDFGWTYSVGPIAGMITPFFVGMIADRFFATERVLGVMHVFGGLIMLGATQLMHKESVPEIINVVFFGYMLTYYPTLALTNTLAMHNLNDSEKEFPLIRVFGTFGWIAAGFALSAFGFDNNIGMFYLAAGCALALGVYSFTLPHTPPPSAGKTARIGELFGLDAFVLLKRPSFLIFMVSSFLICIPLAFYYQLAERTVAQSDLAYPAIKMSYGQMSEVVFMLLMPLFFARLGVKWMLFVGMLAWVVRYGLFAVGAPDQVAWMILLGVALHGICYDFFFVTGQIYTDKAADKNIRGQAQGMLVLFTLGLGMFVGAQIAGRIEKVYTPFATTQLASAAGAISEAVDEQQEALDEALNEQDEAVKTQVNDAYERIVGDTQSASGLSLLTQMKLEIPESQQRFNKAADESTKLISASMKELLDQLSEAGTNEEAVEKAKEQLASARSVEIEKLEELVVEQAAEELNSIEDETVRGLVTSRLQIQRLSAYRDHLNLDSLKLMDWKVIWLIPCVFAAIIMLFFGIAFRTDVSDDDIDADDIDSKPAMLE